MVILINWPDAYDRDSPRAGEVDLILAKHRNGPIKTCTVACTLHMASFRDLACAPSTPVDGIEAS